MVCRLLPRRWLAVKGFILRNVHFWLRCGWEFMLECSLVSMTRERNSFGLYAYKMSQQLYTFIALNISGAIDGNHAILLANYSGGAWIFWIIKLIDVALFGQILNSLCSHSNFSVGLVLHFTKFLKEPNQPALRWIKTLQTLIWTKKKI